jgi:phenylpropionate dioxygenase-like ring-hydroxylating dioxygenase large terminal subunit
MQFTDFWYIVCRSQELRPQTVLARQVLGEWLAIFRAPDGKPVALRDYCLHRHSRLSAGKVCAGQLQCPYHGWVYDASGKVVQIPSAGTGQPLPTRSAIHYATCEQDDYVYVCLSPAHQTAPHPFSMPYYGAPGWATVRVINRFANTVTNCVENFIDIPHTAFVHPRIFRTERQQSLMMTVDRRDGGVWVEYQQETTNLGWFRYFLNPQGQTIKHTDRFQMPNITSVEYLLGHDRHLFITSQSIPETDTVTLVYTDVTYNYGLWNLWARPLVWWTAQRIIRQDIQILGIQAETIAKYGQHFAHTPADIIHVFVESIRDAIARGDDPRQLPHQTATITFWV